jgi:galactokinase
MASSSAAHAAFERAFGRMPDVLESAPGRVNLIGEHTDYSGGYVLPMAIPQRTEIALSRGTGGDAVCRLVSANLGGKAPENFEIGREAKAGTWIDYVQGTVKALRESGVQVPAFDAAISSHVPVGAGLSSSAALEVALLRGLRSLIGFALDDVTIAQLGRKAENEFVGAPVGIMDQMASSLADATTALFLDTRTLAFERVPLPADAEILVIDSGVPHDHAAGNYGMRRAEVEQATAALRVKELRDVDDPAACASLPDPIGRRARHVVTENARVLAAVRAMREGDLAALGKLMDASHASLRDDFQVTVPDVDRLVDLAQADPDVIGARMTGGGFGGAIVALVKHGTGALAGARIVEAYGRRGRVLVPPASGWSNDASSH